MGLVEQVEHVEQVQHGFEQIPGHITARIADKLEERDRSMLACSARWIDFALGGAPAAAERKTSYDQTIRAKKRAKKQAARDAYKDMRRKKKLKLALAIIDYHTNGPPGRREMGVGYKFVAKRQHVYECKLRRLDGRLAEAGFYREVDWEFNILNCDEFSVSTDSSVDTDLGSEGEQ